MPLTRFRGSPALPSDDLTTVKVTYYLVAKKQLDADLITTLTRELMNVRRDLIGEMPALSQIAAADTDSAAYLPVHPGAAAFYNGTQLSFLDKCHGPVKVIGIGQRQRPITARRRTFEQS